ncbi:MAG TPA: CPBP family intramembrane glutamic endopeptidase [Aeromicrobium sp.]|nr:CPBP family intramembrane glutamic endopeptidase [Aeromicrobium sp.]
MVVAVRLTTGVWLEVASSGEEVFTNDVANLFALLATLGILLPLVWVVTLVVHRRWLGTLSSVEGHLRWRWMLLCLVPAVGYIGIAFAAGYGVDALWPSREEGGPWPGWHAFWPPLLMIVLLVPFQAAAEEYVFRGWLLQSLGSFTGEGHRMGRLFGSPWPAIIVSSVPFVAGHAYTDWGILDIGAFAVIVGWVTVRTGGLEAAIALHVVNNMTGMILSASEGDLAIDQGAVPLPEVVVDVAAMLVWALVVVWMFGHTGSKRPMKRLS